jgi:hypothetical protein
MILKNIFLKITGRMTIHNARVGKIIGNVPNRPFSSKQWGGRVAPPCPSFVLTPTLGGQTFPPFD